MVRLLVIEDNEDDVFLIKQYLPRRSYELIHALTVQEGIAALDTHPVELILLDLFLPDSHGLETLYAVVAKQPHVPIVVMTSLDDERTALDALRHGAQDYLVKGQLAAGLLNRVIHYAIERNKILTELAETNARLEQLALVDPLTGLLNRRGLQQVLSLHIKRSRAEDPDSLAILIDMDNFKGINDTHGHAVGDIVLKEVTHKLKSSIRANDHAARIGGDEFMVVLPNTRVAEGVQVAEKMRVAISSSPISLSSGDTLVTTASIGIVPVSSPSVSIDDLLRETHSALYKSKRLGKNQVSYGGALASEAEMLSEQVPRFVKELGAGHLLRVVKQDIYSLSNMSVVGAEYYTRSSLSSYEMPDDFFRLCFESKVLTTVDYHCFRACLKAAAESRISQRVHLNLFPSTLLAIPIERLVRDIAESQLQRILCVEISEQQLIGEPSYLLKAVETLKNEGVQVAIDDVGFGRSCLESLILLEPEIIKIDKRCVKGIAEDPALVRSMRRLLRVTGSLKTQVVAEGIERKEDLDAVVGLGVHYGQGYYLDEPSEN